jgi:DNA modification methylase
MTMRNEVVWFKPPSGLGDGQNNSSGRSFGSITERALFFMLGEQGFNNNSDNYWEGWEPLRTYLKNERDKIGWNNKVVAGFFGFHPRMADHWFSQSQWSMPTEDQYKRLQQEAKKEAFKREHDDLKREHDRIKEEFYKTRAFFDNTHDNMTEVWQFERVKGEERHGHATPKPVEMMERVMKSSAPIGAITIEPFLGSGSTLIGAEKTGRKCYGMELDPKYCDVIVKRWEDFTGKKAELWKP